jgi:4'-phosphopantetheinyl transferase
MKNSKLPLLSFSEQDESRRRMNVYLLEQSLVDVPSQDDWLSTSEAACLARMRFEKRRTDWRLGRWAAKRAIATHLRLPTVPHALAEIEIRPAPSGAPEALLRGHPAGIAISLSHRAGTALCAIADSRAALGCDLEIAEPRSEAFIADYFTAEEQELVYRSDPELRSQLLALLWSAKESALKALCIGLRVDTRSLTVNLMDHPIQLAQSSPSGGDQWHPLRVSFGADRLFEGWWRHAYLLLQTVISTPPPFQPTSLVLATT